VPDLEILARGIANSLAELRELAGTRSGMRRP
jgi:hypothetical protein